MEQLIEEEKQQPVTIVAEHPAAPVAPDPCDPVKSLERYHRYLYASRFVRNKRVLEIGCGEGYGTAFLSLNAVDVLGIDPDESAIGTARCKYQEFTHSRFEVGIHGESIPCPADRDVAICFGMLEHLPMETRHAMMKNMKAAMAPGGVAIITTNVRTVASAFNGNGTDLFTPVEFAEFTKEYFKNVLFVGQKPLTVSSIWSLYQWKDDSFRFHARENLFTLPPDDEQFSEPDQLIAICSDETLPREIADSSKSLYFDIAQHARVEELPARMKSLEEEVQSLGQSVNGLQNDISERDNTIQQLRHELAVSQHRREHTESTLADRERTITALKSDLQNAHTSIETLQQAYDLRTARANSLKEEQTASSSRLKDIELSLDERTQQLQNLSAENVRLRSAMAELEKTVDRKTAELSEVHNMQEQEAQRALDVQALLNESADIAQMHGEEITALQAQVVGLQTLLDETHTNVSASAEELAAYNEEIHLLHSQIRDQEKMSDAFRQETERFRMRNEELERRYGGNESVVKEREQVVSQLETRIKELETAVQDRTHVQEMLKREKAEAESKWSQAQASMKEKTDAVAAMKKELDEKRSIADTAQKEISDRQQKVVQLEQRVKDQTDFLMNLQRESEENGMSARQLKIELEKQISAFDTYQKSQSDLQQRYTRSQIRVQELQATLAMIEQKLEKVMTAPGYKILASVGFVPKEKP